LGGHVGNAGIAKHAGGLDRAKDFARLLLVPGMDRCGALTNGPGVADTCVDMLGALEAWVDKGKAPSEILATKADDSGAPDVAEASVRVARDCDL
jgi:hypothetical protein